jgi:hypothetical protein
MKTLMLGAVFFTSFAISIFPASYTVTLPVGITALANPLNNSSNTPNVLFPDTDGSRDGDMIIYYSCSSGTYRVLTFDSANPTAISDMVDLYNEIPVLAPGRGFYYWNTVGVTESVTFTGAVPTAVYPSPYVCSDGGYFFLGAQNTNSSNYQDYVGAAPQNGSQVLIHKNSHSTIIPIYPYAATNYDIYTFANGAWSPGFPPLAICQPAVFYIPATPQLSINISRANVVLSWPTNAVGFTLLSATNILPTAWITNSTLPAIVNGQNTVTSLISGAQQFYRLSQ